jgi:CHASE3 domain sensor protein
MKWSIEKKTGVGLAVAGLILLLVAGLSYRNARSFIEASEWVSHTRDVLAELDATASNVADAQTATSGYVISGQESILESCRTADPEVRAQLDRIKTLTSDNPDQQRRLAMLQIAVAEELDSLQQYIVVRSYEGFEAAKKRVATGFGTTHLIKVQGFV